MILLKLAWRNIFRNTRRTILTGLAMVVGFVLSSMTFSIIEGTFGDSVKAYTLAGAHLHYGGFVRRWFRLRNGLRRCLVPGHVQDHQYRRHHLGFDSDQGGGQCEPQQRT